MSDGPPKLTNIGYVGGSYDIFKGNPEAIGTLDPGFIYAQNIFNFIYNESKTTTDGAYLIPDGTTVNSVESCSFSFSSSSIASTQSYTDSLKVHVDADFKYLGGSFSSSADYQEVAKGTSSGESVYVSSYAQCATYGASIDDAPLSKEFFMDVNALSSDDSYIELIKKWGTHVASSIMMGGRYGLRSEFTHEGYNSMVSSNLNVKAAGGYSGMMTLSSSLTTDSQETQARSFDSKRKGVQLFVLGGKPPVDENGTAYQWAATVKETPMPISYTLTELYKYLIADYFPHDPNIQQKQDQLHHSLLVYCNMIAPKDLCAMEFGPRNNTIKVSTNSDLHKAVDMFGWTIHYQVSENPSFKSLGAVKGSFGGSHNIPSPFLIPHQNEKVYITSSSGTKSSDHAIRYECEDGYSTISDYTHGGPYIYPCVKNECLAQCNQGASCNQITIVGEEDCYYIENGYAELGNPGNRGFFRDLSIHDDTSVSDLFKCLNYKCLEVV